jgi:putative transposase
MKKSTENTAVNATAFPEQVSVAMAEIAENMQEGLLALAVGAGLQVMQTLMKADVTALAAPRAATTRSGLRCAMAVNKVR